MPDAPSTQLTPAAPSGGRHTRKEDRVGFWEKTALGAGYLPVFLGYAAVNSFSVPVYQMTLQLDPALLALALAIPRFWDAMIDPVVGVVSDNTHSRWGRRRPFIVVGAILQGLAFGLVWMVPESWGQAATAGWLIASLILFYSCFALYSVPLYSLTYEMTPDYEERNRVAAFSGFFHKSGEFVYQWIFPLTGLAIFSSVISGVRTVGWAVGLLLLGCVGLLPGLFVKERYFRKAVVQEKVKFGVALRQSLQNRAFVVLLGLTALQILAGMIASNLDHYLLVYYMSGGDVAQGSVWKGILSTAFAVVGIAMIYPVTWMANRFGKSKTLSFTFLLVLAGAVVKWFVFTPGAGWLVLLDAVFCGPVWVAINVLSLSMLADICDEDELRHGMRREGTFGAIFAWVQKFGYSTAFFGAMLSLKWVGFDAALGGNQSESTILGMRLLLAVPTAIWALAALALLAVYPLSRDRVYAVRDQLEARRGAPSA